MGNYTEIYVNCRLIKDIPQEVYGVCQYLFNGGYRPVVSDLPNHPFFKCDRWDRVGNGNSQYFQPVAVSHFYYDDIAKEHFICSTSNLKNYDSECELFFEWIQPYIPAGESGRVIGWISPYADDDKLVKIIKFEYGRPNK
jgi:hypothetical protein